MFMSYAEYLKETGREDCRDSWVDWKHNIYGMNYEEADKASRDPEWGYEPLTA